MALSFMDVCDKITFDFYYSTIEGDYYTPNETTRRICIRVQLNDIQPPLNPPFHKIYYISEFKEVWMLYNILIKRTGHHDISLRILPYCYREVPNLINKKITIYLCFQIVRTLKKYLLLQQPL